MVCQLSKMKKKKIKIKKKEKVVKPKIEIKEEKKAGLEEVVSAEFPVRRSERVEVEESREDYRRSGRRERVIAPVQREDKEDEVKYGVRDYKGRENEAGEGYNMESGIEKASFDFSTSHSSQIKQRKLIESKRGMSEAEMIENLSPSYDAEQGNRVVDAYRVKTTEEQVEDVSERGMSHERRMLKRGVHYTV